MDFNYAEQQLMLIDRKTKEAGGSSLFVARALSPPSPLLKPTKTHKRLFLSNPTKNNHKKTGAAIAQLEAAAPGVFRNLRT